MNIFFLEFEICMCKQTVSSISLISDFFLPFHFRYLYDISGRKKNPMIRRFRVFFAKSDGVNVD